MIEGRNEQGLTERQIEHCRAAWAVLSATRPGVTLDTGRARESCSLTGYSEASRTVYLGANVFPNLGSVFATARMSMMACLAHELAHAERHALGFARPAFLPDVLLDEAEASLHASFHEAVRPRDRKDLVESAHERILRWLDLTREAGK